MTIPIVDDSIGEPEEVFYGSLSIVGSSPVIITEERADIHITDNDSKQSFCAHFKCNYTVYITHSNTFVPSLMQLFLQYEYGLSLRHTRLMKVLEVLHSL